MKRKPDEKVSDFINRFNKAANKAKKEFGTDLPSAFKGLKLLDDAQLSDTDAKLVLTGMDFSKPEEVYKKV